MNNPRIGNFKDWWDVGEMPDEPNPYRKNSPAYWAWAGWMAATAFATEACLDWCAEYAADDEIAQNIAAALRGKGNDERT